jgi:2-polyprenyl-3-methyl-5-hydroxy-6-metoxy-1,4-benzoquinol methylase
MTCGLVWQRDAPDGPLLDVLYEDLSSSRIFEYTVEDFESLYLVVRRKLTGESEKVGGVDKRSPFWQRIASSSNTPALPGQRGAGNPANPVHQTRPNNPVSLVRQMLRVLYCFGHNNIAVLDFGMGKGRWCQTAATFGFETYGLEYSERLHDLQLGTGYQVITPDELADCRFDFINAEQVFEHLNGPLETLQMLAQTLNSGGVIRISVPSGYGIETRIQRERAWAASKHSKNSLNSVRPLRHVNCFTGRSLIMMAAQAGLKWIKPSLARKLQSAIGLRDVIRAPASWLRRRLRPVYFTEQYFLKTQQGD